MAGLISTAKAQAAMEQAAGSSALDLLPLLEASRLDEQESSDESSDEEDEDDEDDAIVNEIAEHDPHASRILLL